MNRVMFFKCIFMFMFTTNVFALNIGTTNIVFTYEDTSLTLEQQAVVSNCVHKLIEPSLPFSYFYKYKSDTYLEFLIHDYPFKCRMFGKLSFNNNNMTMPITKLFSIEILSRQYLQTKYATAISEIPEFCSKLKTLNVTELSDVDVNNWFLLTERQQKITTNEMNREHLTKLEACTFYEVPLICFKEEYVGPNNGLYLWSYVPNSYSNVVFDHLELIYYNNRWYISSWHLDF